MDSNVGVAGVGMDVGGIEVCVGVAIENGTIPLQACSRKTIGGR